MEQRRLGGGLGREEDPGLDEQLAERAETAH